MPTVHPRVKVTLCQDAHDRLQVLADQWGIPVSGLVRFLADRLAESLQLVELPGAKSVWVRGGPFPSALLGLLPDEAGRDRLLALADTLRLYANDGARPAATFNPPDVLPEAILGELEAALASRPSPSPGALPCLVPAPAGQRREDGATAPPAASLDRRRAALRLVSTPVGNTGVTLPQPPSQGVPATRKRRG